MPLVLRKGSGRVLRPCHFLMLLPLKFGPFKHLICQDRGIRLSAKCVPDASVKGWGDEGGRGMVLRSSNILLTSTKAYG